MTELTDYVCRTGLVCGGGCGNAIARQIIDELDPQTSKNLKLFVANTDARTLKRRFDTTDERVRLWLESGALFPPHQLGGNSITQGRGAGANPEIGRQAAESPESREAMKSFLSQVEEVILVGGLGGGTGTGMLPVAANLCKEMGKSALALVVMPEPEEGLERYAEPALKEIRKKVTTAAIYNERLLEYLTALPEEERRSLTTKQVRKIMNDKSLMRILTIMHEVLQETGEEEFDEADWKMILSYGSHFYFGLSDVEPNKIGDTEEEMQATGMKVVENLFKAEFVDVEVALRGEVIGLWFHGPWPNQMVRQIRNTVRERVLEKQPEKAQTLETHMGLFDEAQDGKMWVALMITAKDEISTLSNAKVEVLKNSWPAPGSESATKTVAVTRADVSQKSLLRRDITPDRTSIDITVRGKTKTVGVPKDLAERFNNIDLSTPTEKVKGIFDEIEAKVKMRPDLPEWHNQDHSSVGSH